MAALTVVPTAVRTVPRTAALADSPAVTTAVPMAARTVALMAGRTVALTAALTAVPMVALTAALTAEPTAARTVAPEHRAPGRGPGGARPPGAAPLHRRRAGDLRR
jgi:hypothetical protein